MKIGVLCAVAALFALSACDDDDNDDPGNDAGLVDAEVKDGEADAQEDSSTVIEKDETPPTIEFDRPGRGEMMTGDVKVKVRAEDNVGVARVVLESDGETLATLTEAPYEWTWEMGDRINGPYKIKATAYDAAGLSASAETKFNYEKTCSENCPPRNISFVAPAAGSKICSSMAILAEAKQSQELKSIAYSANGKEVGKATEFPWFVTLEFNQLTEGPAVLRAELTDVNDKTAAHEIDVTIAKDDDCNEAPIVEIGYLEEGATVSGNYYLHARAFDDRDEVMRVDFYLDGQLLKEMLKEPYRFEWDSTTVADGEHTLWVRAEDRDHHISFDKRNFKVDQSLAPADPPAEEPTEK